MDPNTDDRARLKREILDDLGRAFYEELAGDSWGRILVEVIRGPGGEPEVAGIDVEEIVGDEARVNAAFDGDAVKELLPVLAKATEALCAIDDVALEDVRGGTFVRAEAGFAWLPGLIRAPSLALDRARDELVERLRAKNVLLQARFAGADRVELDVEEGRLRWCQGERELGCTGATLLGSFARPPRTWAWAWSNPTASAAVRDAAARLTDHLVERDLWEISTPAFCTDEPTVWALAALLCERAEAAGVQRIATERGALFALVHELPPSVSRGES